MDEGTSTIYACKTCHIRLAPKICKSDKNGNRGKAYVSCHAKSRDGTHCSYYYWLAEGTDGSPPSSPALSMPSCSPPLLAPPSAQPTATLSSTQIICVKRGCGMGRLHVDCPRKMCRRHCLEAGGCRVKTHLANNLQVTAGAMLPFALGGQERPLSSSPPPSNPPSWAPSVNLVPAGSSTTVDSALDFFANPRHASQIVPAFTQQYAREQALEESKRVADAERLANIEKAKHSVMVYGWARDDQEATIFEAQGGFKWPHFVLSAEVLGEVDLLVGAEDDVRVDMYNTSIGRWTKVRVGQVVLMKDCDHVFVKGVNVTTCLNFDTLLTESKYLRPHFLDNLPQERAFVRKALKERMAAKSIVAAGSDADEEPAVIPKVPKGKKGKSSHHKSSPRPHSSSHGSDDDEPEVVSFVRASSRKPEFEVVKPKLHHLARTVSPVHTIKVERVEPSFIDLTLSDDDNATAEVVTIKKELDLSILSDAGSHRRRHEVHKRTHSSASISSSSLSGSSGLSPSEEKMPAWPSDFYVMDIVYGFKECESASRGRGNVKETFEAIYKTPFRRTTYYKHRKTWFAAPIAARDAAMKAGRTSKGLWVYFLKQFCEESAQRGKETRYKKVRV